MLEQQVENKIEEVAVPAQSQSPIEAKEEETPQQIDWRKFKEARKVERQQKEEAEKRAAQKTQEAEALKAAMEALLNKNAHVSSHGYEQNDESEDDLIQKKIDLALANERKRVENERIQREHAEFPQRLAQTYPDFDQICSSENLDYLEYHYPEIAGAFKNAPDNFDKWSNVYKAVKRFLPNAANIKDQKKAERNFNKPQSMAVGGVTQTGDTAPMMLDDKRRADNWSRMQKVMKGGR